jgi:hypothetical protein
MNPELKMYRVVITEAELKQLNDSGKKQFFEALYSPKHVETSVQLYLRLYEGHDNAYEQRAKANEFAKRILSAHGQPWDSRLGELWTTIRRCLSTVVLHRFKNVSNIPLTTTCGHALALVSFAGLIIKNTCNCLETQRNISRAEEKERASTLITHAGSSMP